MYIATYNDYILIYINSNRNPSSYATTRVSITYLNFFVVPLRSTFSFFFLIVYLLNLMYLPPFKTDFLMVTTYFPFLYLETLIPL